MPAYEPASRCTGGPTPGAQALVAHWTATTGLGNAGIYVCRPVRGSSGTLSVHSEGRAADLSANALDPAQRRAGDRYAAWLVANAEALGVQQIIWNRRAWRSSGGWRPYSGVNPHIDHLHVELTRAAAARPSPLWGSPLSADLQPGDRVDASTPPTPLTPEQQAIVDEHMAQLNRGDFGDLPLWQRAAIAAGIMTIGPDNTGRIVEAGGISVLGWADALGRILSALLDPSTWWRVGRIILGVALVLVGALIVFRDTAVQAVSPLAPTGAAT